MALFARGVTCENGRLSLLGFGSFCTAYAQRHLSQLHQVSTMNANPKQQKRQDNTLSLLGVAIDAMELAKEVSSVTPAKAVFGSVSIILTMIRVCFPPFYDSLFRAHV